MQTFTTKNNFNHFKADFKKDTNLVADKNIGLYIQYYNARFTDWHYQLLFELVNKVNNLPTEIARAMGGAR